MTPLIISVVIWFHSASRANARWLATWTPATLQSNEDTARLLLLRDSRRVPSPDQASVCFSPVVVTSSRSTVQNRKENPARAHVFLCGPLSERGDY